MIERIGGEILANCDKCGYEETFDACDWDWQDVVDEIKAEGWKIYKVRGEWRNMCPDCRRKR